MTEVKKIFILNRRRTLAFLGTAGASALLRAAGTCIPVAAPQTEGPYWVEENLNRADIRVDPSDGSVRPGVLLTLVLNLHEITGTDCLPLSGAHVDLWHCDASGVYSDVAANGTVGKKFLRGYQVTDDSGAVQFTTIYPGWYSGRTVHIHVRVRTYSGSSKLDEFTAQLFFDDTVTDQVFTKSPYSSRRARDTRNTNDMVLTQTSGTVLYLKLAQTAAGYSGSADIGVNLKTPAVSKAVIGTQGVVNAASYQAGAAPGAWITIFGQNLASSTRAVATSDLVNGSLPVSLGGVSVSIDNKPAFIQFVSPTQINVQAPADNNTGSVQVTVTNANGTSDAVTATLQTVLPALFTDGTYVAAVRPDGSVATGSAVKAGDQLALYGTGFGATDPVEEPGVLFQGAAALTNPVTVTVGGVAAPVSFAGLSAAGLYQFNITVPAVTSGDHEVLVSILGQRSQSGAMLKTQG